MTCFAGCITRNAYKFWLSVVRRLVSIRPIISHTDSLVRPFGYANGQLFFLFNQKHKIISHKQSPAATHTLACTPDLIDGSQRAICLFSTSSLSLFFGGTTHTHHLLLSLSLSCSSQPPPTPPPPSKQRTWRIPKPVQPAQHTLLYSSRCSLQGKHFVKYFSSLTRSLKIISPLCSLGLSPFASLSLLPPFSFIPLALSVFRQRFLLSKPLTIKIDLNERRQFFVSIDWNLSLKSFSSISLEPRTHRPNRLFWSMIRPSHTHKRNKVHTQPQTCTHTHTHIQNHSRTTSEAVNRKCQCECQCRLLPFKSENNHNNNISTTVPLLLKRPFYHFFFFSSSFPLLFLFFFSSFPLLFLFLAPAILSKSSSSIQFYCLRVLRHVLRVSRHFLFVFFPEILFLV